MINIVQVFDTKYKQQIYDWTIGNQLRSVLNVLNLGRPFVQLCPWLTWNHYSPTPPPPSAERPLASLYRPSSVTGFS